MHTLKTSDNREIPARTMNQAREIAYWIAKKDNVFVRIVSLVGNFVDLIISPDGMETEAE